MRINGLLALALIGTVGVVASGSPASAEVSPIVTQDDLVGPAGSEWFGRNVIVLTNGNYVVADERHDEGGMADVGALYLYDGMTDVVISRLVGSTAGDKVSSGGVYEVGDSNFLVGSGDWDNGPDMDVGAITWVDGEAGLAGEVATTNSFIGSAPNDGIGAGITHVLANGNAVRQFTGWDGGRGAVTWFDGNAPTVGVVGPSLSLVGALAGDVVGLGDVIELTDGDYVVRSEFNTNGPSSGSVTWVNGETGLSGEVTAMNSLVGNAGDGVGSDAFPLSDGDYVVSSADWNGGGNDYGAATWGNGNGGTVGLVSASNSLIGSTDFDNVSDEIFALTNGNYVVVSTKWDGTNSNVGAVTWGSGDGSTVGLVSASNSLVGTDSSDEVGSGDVRSLTNGNYVVSSPRFDGAGFDRGAATWGGGTGGLTGEISDMNSLIGTYDADGVSSGDITALTNGNYVVSSPLRDTSVIRTDTGAVTWGNGTTGVTGEISTLNSLIGGSLFNGVQVGRRTIALTNGNWVTASQLWDIDGGVANVGAATWGDGESGTFGIVTKMNSLTGSTASDRVGGEGLVALPNGNYLVRTETWSGGGSNRGSVTWGDGDGGTTGEVGPSNSLVGNSDNDFVGSVVPVVLADGDYVVVSPEWGAFNYGAATWGDGDSGVSGVVNFGNSLLGSTLDDDVGDFVVPLDIGGYVVMSDMWDDGVIIDAGAATFGPSMVGVAGNIDSDNSVTGTPPGEIRPGKDATRLTSGDSYPVPTSQNRVLLMRLDRPPVFASSPLDVAAESDVATAVSFPVPVAGDVRDGPIVSVCAPSSGSTFPLGDTVVMCTATDSKGQSAATTFTVSVAPAPVVPDPDPDPEVVSLTPGRVFASRSSDETVDGLFQGEGRVPAGSFVEVDITGRAGVASDAKAVVMNVTAINPSGRGFATAYPCGDRPLASSLNYGSAGAVVGNELIAKLSSTGQVCVFSSAATDLTIDVVGYVPASSDVVSTDPARVYATRVTDETVDGLQKAQGRIAAGEFVEVEIAGRAGVPASGAASVVMNVTAINPSGRGFATAYPCGTRPLASSGLLQGVCKRGGRVHCVAAVMRSL